MDIPLKWIDITEHAHDKKFGPVWDHVAMHVIMKSLDIGKIYQLVAASELQPVPVMRLDQKLESTLAPNIHVLGTHTRDVFMCHRVHQICEANPGKTILAVMGAFHSLNIRETLWKRRMPEALVSGIASDQQGRKQLHKVFKRYNGRIFPPAKDCDYTLFAERE